VLDGFAFLPLIAICPSEDISLATVLLFIILSILSCTVPYVAKAWFNYEFPSLVGGAIGLFISVGVASKGIGLSKTDNSEMQHEKVKTSELLKALFPTASLIVILALTRIKQLPLKALLNDTTEWFTIKLGYLGDFQVTKGLIFSLKSKPNTLRLRSDSEGLSVHL